MPSHVATQTVSDISERKYRKIVLFCAFFCVQQTPLFGAHNPALGDETSQNLKVELPARDFGSTDTAASGKAIDIAMLKNQRKQQRQQK